MDAIVPAEVAENPVPESIAPKPLPTILDGDRDYSTNGYLEMLEIRKLDCANEFEDWVRVFLDYVEREVKTQLSLHKGFVFAIWMTNVYVPKQIPFIPFKGLLAGGEYLIKSLDEMLLIRAGIEQKLRKVNSIYYSYREGGCELNKVLRGRFRVIEHW